MKGNFFISEKKVKNQNKFEFILVKRILPILVIGLGIFLIVDGGNYFNYQNEFIKSILSQMTGFIISFFGLFLISNEISLKGVYKIISYIFMLLFITFIIYTVKNLFLQEWRKAFYCFLLYAMSGSIALVCKISSSSDDETTSP